MFDVSFSELMVVGVVALIVIGPERLPKVAKTLGHLVGRAQRYVNNVKSDIQREMDLDDLRKFKDQVQEAAQSVKSSISEAQAAVTDPLKTFEKDTMDTLHEVSHDAALASSEATSTTPPDQDLAKVELTDSDSALAQVEAATPSTTAPEPAVALEPEAVEPSAIVSAEPALPKQLEIDALQPQSSPATAAAKPAKTGANS